MSSRLRPSSTPDPDTRRRVLLVVSDDLLEQIEQLRLGGHRRTPDTLRVAIARLRQRAGEPALDGPAGLRAAHESVLALQARIMSLNPRYPSPTLSPHRQPADSASNPENGGGWRPIALPPRYTVDAEREWFELVEATVARAFERWLYASHHLAAACRAGRPAPLAWARAAWHNYWQLREDADRILRAADGPGGSAA